MPLLTTGAGVFPASGGGGWATLIPQSGLVNAWPFDTANTTTSSATDVIGGKNATFTSVTLNGSGPSTNLNNAAVFNGTSSHADTPGPASSTPPPRTAFSIVYWMFPISLTGSPVVIGNDLTAGADNDGIRFFYDAVNTRMLQFVGNGTTSATPPNPAATFPVSTWSMSTVTYDGTTLTSYINTTSLGTQALAGPNTTPTNALAFGYDPRTGAEFFNGMIAGIAIYNRVLSGSEVTTIHGL